MKNGPLCDRTTARLDNLTVNCEKNPYMLEKLTIDKSGTDML